MSSRNRETKLVLFDMDGTLINIGLTHRKAVHIAVRTVYGLEIDRDLDPKTHQGNTQPNIIRAIGSLMGQSPEVTEAHLDEAIRVLSQTTTTILDEDLRREVLPGVVPLLETLQEAEHALGLVTGTVSATTSVILERTGLRRYFPVRACGDEGGERVDLLQLAIHRAARTYGLKPGRNGLVVVGDSVRDIEAGKAVGARVVAVATGVQPPDLLAQHDPEVVLPNLEDLQVALDAIVSFAEDPEGS